MALSLFVRNSSKFRGISFLPKTAFTNTQKVQNFTHLCKNGTTKTSQYQKLFFNGTMQNQIKRNMSGDHGKMWTLEKLFSLALLGIIPATFICPSQLLDDIFATAIVVHFHWGLEAIVIDYMRPVIVGPVLPKISIVLLYIISATTLGGLLYFNHTQIGIGKAVNKLWCIGDKNTATK